MVIAKLKKNTISILKKAGWYEGRREDRKLLYKFLEDYGWELFPKAKEVADEMDGISICNHQEKGTIEIYFDMSLAIGFKSFILAYKDMTGERLYPLGLMWQDDFYIGESGKIYCWKSSTYDVKGNNLYFVASDIESFLNKVLSDLEYNFERIGDINKVSEKYEYLDLSDEEDNELSNKWNRIFKEDAK